MASPTAEKQQPKPIVNGVPSGAPETVKPPPARELGFDGIGNFGGNLQNEENPDLRGSTGFGTASSTTWGELERRRRTDEAVSAALDFVLAPIRDALVTVKPGDDTPLAADIAEYCRWNLTEKMEPGWPELLQQTCGGALSNGFAVHEIVPDQGDHELLPIGTGTYVKKLAERLPRTMANNAWREDGEGNLVAIRQQGSKGGKYSTVDLPVANVLLNTWNRNGNNYAGFSAFRSVWYACKVREHILKMTAVSMVREGAGIPVAFATDLKSELSKEQRAEMQQLLENLVYHENAAVVMSPGWDLRWEFSKGANKGHLIDVFNQLGLLILRQLGAQQLYLGTSETGSRSVGEVHSAQAEVVVLGVIANFEGMINGVASRPYTGLIRKLVDWNWGPQKSYPKLCITPKRQKLKPLEKAQALKTAKEAGVFTPTVEDENVFREELGLEPIDEATRDAEKQKAAELAPPQTSAPFGNDDEPEGKRPPRAAAFRGAATGIFVPRRPLRASEKALDLQGMARLFDTSREDFARGVKPLVAELLMRALDDVRAAMADGDASDVGDVKLDMSRVDAFVAKYLQQLRREGYQHVAAERRRGRPTTAAAEEEDDQRTDGPAAEEAEVQVTQQRKHLVKRIRNRLSSDLEREAIDVERTEGDPEQVVARTLERQVDTGAFRSDAGLVTTKAFNVGRDEFAQEFGSEVESVELTAVMDSATCTPCDTLDGNEFDFNSEEHLAHVPPLSNLCLGGDNCRCILVYNFKRGER